MATTVAFRIFGCNKELIIKGYIMSEEIKFTSKEWDEYCNSGENILSDMDYGYNRETGEYTLPALEWDSDYGKHWEYFNTEEEREKALEDYRKGYEGWLLNYRAEMKIAYWAKEYEKSRIKSLKTLGGQFEILQTLKSA